MYNDKISEILGFNGSTVKSLPPRQLGVSLESEDQKILRKKNKELLLTQKPENALEIIKNPDAIMPDRIFALCCLVVHLLANDRYSTTWKEKLFLILDKILEKNNLTFIAFAFALFLGTFFGILMLFLLFAKKINLF